MKNRQRISPMEEAFLNKHHVRGLGVRSTTKPFNTLMGRWVGARRGGRVMGQHREGPINNEHNNDATSPTPRGMNRRTKNKAKQQRAYLLPADRSRPTVDRSSRDPIIGIRIRCASDLSYRSLPGNRMRKNRVIHT